MWFFSNKRAKHILDDGAAELNAQDLDRAINNRQRILEKVLTSATLAPYISQVKILLTLIQDYVKGEYREIPWWSLGSIATALLYILMPLDALPDFIPITGYLDDAVVLKLCLDMVSKDLTSYRQFKHQNNDTLEP
ncbi:MAG: uncharacterized membrane protein YkvA (DUF1232 family) [Zhongshania sp.]|jgi:uncharacterized membrane protein YkvA (DUF1232 family)